MNWPEQSTGVVSTVFAVDGQWGRREHGPPDGHSTGVFEPPRRTGA